MMFFFSIQSWHIYLNDKVKVHQNLSQSEQFKVIQLPEVEPYVWYHYYSIVIPF